MAKYYPLALTDENLHPARVKFHIFERHDTKSSSPLDEIYLYMPENAVNPQSVSWDNAKFGYGGKLFEGGVNSATEAWDTWGANLTTEGLGGNIAEFATNVGYRAGLSIGNASAAIMGSSATGEDVLAHVHGRIPNPYIVKIFRGHDFRTFGFSFKFAPFNVSDCFEIHNIIKSFRAYSLPEHSSNATFLDYPMEFQIEYQWKGRRNEWLHKFKRAVLTTINLNYTSQGMFSVHRNGFPTSIEFTMSFTEIEKLFRSEVMNEGY